MRVDITRDSANIKDKQRILLTNSWHMNDNVDEMNLTMQMKGTYSLMEFTVKIKKVNR